MCSLKSAAAALPPQPLLTCKDWRAIKSHSTNYRLTGREVDVMLTYFCLSQNSRTRFDEGQRDIFFNLMDIMMWSCDCYTFPFSKTSQKDKERSAAGRSNDPVTPPKQFIRIKSLYILPSDLSCYGLANKLGNFHFLKQRLSFALQHVTWIQG